MRPIPWVETTDGRLLGRGKPAAIAAIAMAAVLATGVALAQQSPPKAADQRGMGRAGMMMKGSMGDRSQQMMAMHTGMAADMKAMDVSLDQKVAAMNAAKGSAKIDAMAAVINEMAAQRKQMMAKMSSMHKHMMAYMEQPGDTAGPEGTHSGEGNKGQK